MTGPQLSLHALAERVSRDDGYLPDGRAVDAGEDGWMAFLAHLRTSGWAVTRGGAPLTLWPTTAGEAAAGEPPTLQVRPSERVLINVFPDWGTGDIHFDFDMREMRQQEDADAVMSFVRLLGAATQRAVVLAQEGAEYAAIARYEPEHDALTWTQPNDDE